MKMDKKRKMGYLLTILGGTCWACSGACGQFLFENRGLDANWVVTMRLLLAGLLLSAYSVGRWRSRAVDVFRSAKSIGALLVLGVLGLALCQYSYFRSIELSNAATATTMQYTGPALVLIWLALRDKRMPRRNELIAVACAVGGAFLLATHGDPSQLVLSSEALFWCLLGACAFAIYSVQPRGIISRFGTMPVTGFGMLIGGLVMCVIFKPWNLVGEWDIVTVLGMAFIVLFGTLCAFCCYLEGVRRIGAARGSILAAVEPVVSALLSVFWLGVPLGGMDFAGIALIVAAMVLLAGDDKDKPDEQSRETDEKIYVEAEKD